MASGVKINFLIEHTCGDMCYSVACHETVMRAYKCWKVPLIVKNQQYIKTIQFLKPIYSLSALD